MKIKSLRIESFRGIPHDLTIDMFKDDKPSSVIIFGDNGTGKSSIIDAIEFCLQARINRTKHLKNELFPYPNSLYSPKSSKIEIEFEKDSGKITRELLIERDETSGAIGYKTFPSNPHEKFKISPIVLRRKDVLQFINTPSRERQVIFFDFLRDSQIEDWEKNPPIEYERLLKKRTKLKSERRRIRRELASFLEIEEDAIPLVSSLFDKFVAEHIYKGVNKKKRDWLKRKGKDLNINQNVIDGVRRMKECHEKFKSNNREINFLKRDNTARLDKELITKDTLLSISSFVTDSFNSISNSKFIKDISVEVGEKTKVSFDIMIELENGEKGTPNNIFSEANQDLLSLLIFLSFLKESSNLGQGKILVLDDVLQSVDSTIRLAFANFLLQNFTDWQLIISVHDRLWLNQLKNVFQQNNMKFVEKEIIRWSFAIGPVIRNSNYNLDDALEIAIEEGNFEYLCSQTGVFLEQICNELSYGLPISVKRRYGDKYTLGDLWPGIFKILKKSNLEEVATKVNNYIHLRNLIGAHYNEWAQTLSSYEANEFTNSVLSLYRKVFCKKCYNWVRNINNEKLWQCRCKEIEINYTIA